MPLRKGRHQIGLFDRQLELPEHREPEHKYRVGDVVEYRDPNRNYHTRKMRVRRAPEGKGGYYVLEGMNGQGEASVYEGAIRGKVR